MHMKANLTLPVQVAECQTFHTSEVSIQRCRPALWTVQHRLWLEKQRKTPYPPPPRVFPCKDMWVRLGKGMEEGFAMLFVRLLC